MKKLIILFCGINLFFTPLFSQNQPQHSKKVVGYYAQWAIYARDYNVLDVEADKLTHLMYAFYDATYDASTQTGSIESLDEYADYNHNESGMHAWDAPVKGNIGDLKLLKEQFPHLKVLISVGGWTKSQNFPAIAASQNARETFAQSMVDFMTTYPWIDGFDLDWEFPIVGGTDGNETINGRVIPAQPHTANDHKNFVFLLKETRERFDANGMQNKEVSISMGNNVLNAASQFIGPNNESANGMTENIMDFCDFVSFFGYDFGGNWYDKTCYNAPLFGGDYTNDPLHNPSGRNQVLSELVDVYLTDVGIPANKLVMGLPFYGKLFEGVASTGIVANLSGLYESAPRTNNSACSMPQPPQGTWDDVNCENSGSIEFCDLSQGIGTNVHHYLDTTNPLTVSSTATTNGWVRYWDDTAKVPYLYNATENKFISYDDAQSIDLKVKYALTKQLGGVMIWELSQDSRGDTVHSLLNAVESSLQNAPYDIVLNFKDTSNQPLVGVAANLYDADNNLIETLVSDSNGVVNFEEKQALRAYSVTYSLTNYNFLPATVSYTALEFDSDKSENIIASDESYTIDGTVSENGQLLTGANIILKLDTEEELYNEVSSTGNFSLNAIGGLNCELTAQKQYYSFSNINYSNLSSNQANQEITATRNIHTISGTITSDNAGLQGVSVSVVGNGQTYTDTTDANGNYSISNVVAGYNYTVTPSQTDVEFNLINWELQLLNDDITINFEENLGLIFGTVKDGTTPIEGAVVSLKIPWTDNHPYRNITKTTNSAGEYFYTETELSGYNTITTLKLETWQNNNTTYYPTDLANIAITTNPQEFNFNSQPVTPEITINNPNTSSVNNAYGTSLSLEALVELSYDDGNTNLSSVIFKLNDSTISTTNNVGIYSGMWTPTDSDYGTTHTFTVEAQSSNGETATKSFAFALNCTETSCPNIAPTIEWISPSNTTVNQTQGFQSIPIETMVTDLDGTVSSVAITIDGATLNMIAGTNDTYTHNFTPSNHQQYPVVIKATDNDGDITTFNETLNITNSNFVPLPSGNIILGYAHSWENAEAPFLYFNEMKDKKYNVVMYSFIETVGQNGYSPQLTINSNRYQTNGNYDSQLLKDDIQSLRDEGIPVIVSIGGQNGHVELNTVAEKDEFVQGLKDIVDEYGFDGIDLDFEGGSMNFEAGALTDFSYTGISTYPKLKLVVDAFKEIKQHYGTGFILTCAPETYYVQVGKDTYSNTAGAFLPVIHNLRNELDLIMVQLYNTGSISALDGQAYSQATPDFLTSMSDMLITGFDVASTGFNFSGLPASKIMVGIPSCPTAAPSGGYINPSDAIKALDYLRFGTDFSGRSYTLQNSSHSGLRGVMTWSINWDAALGCASAYEFSNSYDDYFFETLGNNYDIQEENNITISPNPVTDIVTINTNNQIGIKIIEVFDMLGKKVSKANNVNYINLKTLENGTYFIKIETDSEKIVIKKIIKN